MVQTPAKAATPAPKAPAAAKEPIKAQPINRREFLNYIWGASIALSLAETAGAVVWFILPVFKAGEFGAPFSVDIGLVPPPDSGPVGFPALRFWLLNIGDTGAALESTKPLAGEPSQAGHKGVVALYTVCTHLGCLYKWVDTNGRFECPCHGSKYHTNGTYIEGPTPRNLDRMQISFVDASGTVLAKSDDKIGNAVEVPAGATQIIVETGKIIRGRPHA